jgi:hypothetical protein
MPDRCAEPAVKFGVFEIQFRERRRHKPKDARAGGFGDNTVSIEGGRKDSANDFVLFGQHFRQYRTHHAVQLVRNFASDGLLVLSAFEIHL